jgi:hypothetical protein
MFAVVGGIDPCCSGWDFMLVVDFFKSPEVLLPLNITHNSLELSDVKEVVLNTKTKKYRRPKTK